MRNAVRKITIAISTSVTLGLALFGATASGSANVRPFQGTLQGPVPGQTNLNESQEGGIAMLVAPSKLNVLVFAEYGCKNGPLTNAEMSILNVPLRTNGSFHASGKLGTKNFKTAGTPGGIATISGQIKANRASGHFSINAHREGSGMCLAVSLPWSAAYDASAAPDLPTP